MVGLKDVRSGPFLQYTAGTFAPRRLKRRFQLQKVLGQYVVLHHDTDQIFLGGPYPQRKLARSRHRAQNRQTL